MVTGWSAHELLQRAHHLTQLSLPQNYISQNPFHGLLIFDSIHLCIDTSSVSAYLKCFLLIHCLVL